MGRKMNGQYPFKNYACGSAWKNREAFLRDDNITPAGMTLLPRNASKKRYFHFNRGKYRSAPAIDAGDFTDLIEEPVPRSTIAGEEERPGHCTNIENLEKRENECSNAPSGVSSFTA